MAPNAISLPVGGHFFTPEALQKAVTEATANLPPDKKNVLIGTVDASGAKVALVMKSQDNAWQIRTAFAHDWATGDNSLGASVVHTW